MRIQLALVAPLLVAPAVADDWGAEVPVTQDPVLQFRALLAIDGNDVTYTLWPDYSDDEETRVNLQTSGDRGATWSAPNVIFGGTLYEGFDLFADESGLHVLLIEFFEDDEDEFKWLYYSRSVDGGATWTNPVQVGDDELIFQARLFSDGGTLYAYAQNEDFEPFVYSSPDGVDWTEHPIQLAKDIGNPDFLATNGTIHMVFGGTGFGGDPEIHHAASVDDGATWSTPTDVSVGAGVHSQLPSMALDASGNLHVVWEDDRSGRFEIRYAASGDGGATWSADSQMNDTAYGARAKILRDGDALNVVWTQYHGDSGWPNSWSSGDFGILWHKQSIDDGATWSAENRVSENGHIDTMDLPDEGADRVRVAAFQEGFAALWQDKRDGNFDVYFRGYGELGSIATFGFGNGCPCGNDDPSAGCANSTGNGALLAASGSASAAADDLTLTVTNVIPMTFGLFYVGSAQTSVFLGDGLRVVDPGPFVQGYLRFPAQHTGSDGILTLGPGIVAFSESFDVGPFVAGDTWLFQAFYRDSGSTCGTGFNFTNGLAVTFGQ